MTPLPPNPTLEDLPDGALVALRTEALVDGANEFAEEVDEELKRRSTPERHRRVAARRP